MSGSKDILFVVYIRPSYLIKYSSNFFQEYDNMSKINNTKKAIEDMNVFRKYFRVRQDFSEKIQTIISFIKYELQTSIENNISCKKGKENILVEWGWTKTNAHYELYGKTDHKNVFNIREYHIFGWWQNKSVST